MTKKDQVELFIQTNDSEYIKEYCYKLQENLSNLNSKESANTLWLIGVVFLYILLHNSTIESLQLGFISIKDSSILLQILPVVYIYFLFTLNSISTQKKNLDLALNIIAEHILTPNITKGHKHNFIVRIFIPSTFGDSLKMIMPQKNPHIIEAIIGFVLLLPFFIVALSIYGFIIYMIVDVWSNYSESIMGKISLALTIYMFLLLIYYHTLKIKSDDDTLESNSAVE